MREFFKNRTNVLLLGIVSVLVISAIGIGFIILKPEHSIVSQDFSNYSVKQVNEWCSNNNIESTKCIINYEYSESVEDGKLIYQSVKQGDKVDGTISFTFSKGKEISYITLLTIDSKTNKEAVENWAKENKITKITYKEENSDTVEKDIVIKIVPNSNITKDSELTVYLSLGKKESESKQEKEVKKTYDIEQGYYYGLSETAFNTKAKDMNLVPVHYTDNDEYSKNINKGEVIWHGYGTYEEGENFRYSLSLGTNDNLSIVKVKEDKYLELSESDFIDKMNDLGLKTLRVSSLDQNSVDVTKGKIIAYEDGEYYEGETVRYGLSLGISYPLTIKEKAYVGISLSEFKEIAKDFGLEANHKTEWDDYSDTIEKGYIIKNGYSDDYQKGDNWSYGLSLGKKDSSTITYPLTITSGIYVNKTEAEFKTKAEEFGLKAVHNSEWDNYSDSVSKGNVIKHGSGSYDKNEEWRYGLSLGKKDSSTITYPLTITSGTYVNKTEAEFKTKAEEFGLKAIHNSEWDNYSDSVSKGNIIKHGSGSYDKNEEWRYGLSLGKKDSSTTITYPVTIKDKEYVGKTLEEFKSIASNLGLTPSHNESWDDYSDAIAKGSIIRHGYTEYDKGESWRYGLSLGKKPETSKITINDGAYVGKSVDEFTRTIEALGLKVSYNSANDSYSTSVDAGKVVSHDSGTYEKGDTVKYSKSLGKDSSVNVNSGYEGKTESEFKTYISGLGLSASKTSEEYSSTVTKGSIISYSTGKFNKDGVVTYVLSKGEKTSKLLNLDTLNQLYAKDNADDTEAQLKKSSSLSAFSNVTYKKVATGHDEDKGLITSISVNGVETEVTSDYPVSSAIVITISTGKN